jgi:toxin ParE1/3/4
MAKVILRQEAIDDLNDIWDYTFEQWSENQADKYYATLKFACEKIGEKPKPWERISEIRKIYSDSNLENTLYSII